VWVAVAARGLLETAVASPGLEDGGWMREHGSEGRNDSAKAVRGGS
jgi:hypothetical protein